MIFVTSQSAAQALAQQRGERVLPDSELLGLGAANIASGLRGVFRSREHLPFRGQSRGRREHPAREPRQRGRAGAVLTLPTGWLAPLPLPALAAMIIVAVSGMIDIAALKEAWRYDRADALAMIVTAAGCSCWAWSAA